MGSLLPKAYKRRRSSDRTDGKPQNGRIARTRQTRPSAIQRRLCCFPGSTLWKRRFPGTVFGSGSTHTIFRSRQSGSCHAGHPWQTRRNLTRAGNLHAPTPLKILKPDPICRVREFAVKRRATSFHPSHALSLKKGKDDGERSRTACGSVRLTLCNS